MERAASTEVARSLIERGPFFENQASYRRNWCVFLPPDDSPYTCSDCIKIYFQFPASMDRGVCAMVNDLFCFSVQHHYNQRKRPYLNGLFHK